jgi:hypothetical protein
MPVSPLVGVWGGVGLLFEIWIVDASILRCICLFRPPVFGGLGWVGCVSFCFCACALLIVWGVCWFFVACCVCIACLLGPSLWWVVGVGGVV